MAKRLPASMRTRQNLSELIEGRLSSSAGRSELVELAARLIIEEALEEESRDALGRTTTSAAAMLTEAIATACARVG